jgi:hypothetical protein
MPVSKQLQYDHHAYLTPITFAGQTTVGANGVSPKFAAFTALQLRACSVTPNVASTAAGSQSFHGAVPDPGRRSRLPVST